MKVSEFLNRMETMDPAEKSALVTKIDNEFGPCERHTKWLADWRKACEAHNDSPDCPKGDEEQSKAIYDLTVRLATTPALIPADLKAQIEWFEDDLGEYVKGSVCSELGKIFDTLKIGVENLSRHD